jgi:glycosyltransferase involved in cell wall biosynthesis
VSDPDRVLRTRQVMPAAASPPPAQPELSLVLACYNEEAIVDESVEVIVHVLDTADIGAELVFVDDGSRDRTRERIQTLARQYGERVDIQTLFRIRNGGRGRAVSDGMRLARGRLVGFIDVDLEIDAGYVVDGIRALRAGADVAVAWRVHVSGWRSPGRYVMSRSYAWLVRRLLRLSAARDTEAGFKLFRREKLLPLLADCREAGWFWDTEIMALAEVAGLAVAEIPCRYVRRFDKPSSVRPLRDSLVSLAKLWRFRARLERLRREAG